MGEVPEGRRRTRYLFTQAIFVLADRVPPPALSGHLPAQDQRLGRELTGDFPQHPFLAARQARAPHFDIDQLVDIVTGDFRLTFLRQGECTWPNAAARAAAVSDRSRRSVQWRSGTVCGTGIRTADRPDWAGRPPG